jgi:UDP-glucuronate 4-epimerase
VPILTLRLSNMFGPSPPPRYDLIHRVCSQLLDKGCATIRSRKPERDFVYVEDVVQAVGKLLDADFAGMLNLGSGTMTPVGRVMDILSEISGCGIRCLDEPVDGPLRFQCDMTALHRVIDWTPRPLEDSLRSTFLRMKTGFRT